MSRFLIPLLAVLFMPSLYSQENYQTSWYSADNNYLPQNSVKSIVKDKYGFVWLSTENGLVRYDGANFKVYSTAHVKGLASDRMISFWGSVKKDSLFIKTEKKESVLINKRRVSIFKGKDRRQPLVLKKPFFILYEETVIGKHHSHRNEFFKIIASKGHYIIGNDSIRRYGSNQKLAAKQALRYPDASQFFAVDDKLYLFKGDSEYLEFDDSGFRRKAFQKKYPDGTIYSNPAAHQSFLYSGKNLYQLELIDGKLQPMLLLEDFDFPGNNIISVYYDAGQKIIYAGSYSKGLALIKPKSHHTFKRPDSDGIYYALAPFGKDKAVTSTGDIFGSDGYEGTLNIGKKTDKYMLLTDSCGNIWTKEYRTLYCFTKRSNYRKSRSWIFPERITAVVPGPDGRIWIATQTSPGSGQISYLWPCSDIARPISFTSVPFIVNCMNFVSASRCFIGSERGLHTLDIDNRKYSDVYTARDIYVRSIYIKNSGEIWATTYNKGFFLYKDGAVTFFPTDRNGYLLASHCIAEDVNGYFWVPTNRGLFQMKRQELLKFASREKSSVYYHYYDKNAGFFSNEFNGGCQPCTAILGNKAVFFPSLNGVVVFNPEHMLPNLPTSRLFLDEIEIDGKVAAAPADTIKLERDFNRIRFAVSSPYYGNPYNQHIEFSLSGPVHQDWTTLSAGHIAFSRLPAGKYSLLIRKRTGFDGAHRYLKIHIIVPAPFWESGWFFAAVALLLSVLIYLFTSMRVRYIKYKNILLERKVALQTKQLHDTISTLKRTKTDLDRQVKTHKRLLKTITHDIKSPLRFIKMTGRFIYQNPLSGSISQDAEAIYTSSEQLYNFVDNFLENSKSGDIASRSEPYSLKGLAAEKIAFFRSIARAKDIQLLNSISDDLVVVTNRHLLSIILHNLLDNAIKNTPAGNVECSSYVDEKGRLGIVLLDTGTGIGDANIRHYQQMLERGDTLIDPQQDGFGLSIVIDLLHVLGGTMLMDASKKGTRITLIFPNAF